MIVHQFNMKKDGRENTRWARFTPEGNYLVTSENPGVVTEYNRKGRLSGITSLRLVATGPFV